MNIIFKNIKQLLQVRTDFAPFIKGKEMKNLPIIKNAFLQIKDGKIHHFGEMNQCPSDINNQIIDAHDRLIMPTWCDSHTHIVFAGNREQEFVDRIKGLSYEEISKHGGGILNSAKILHNTSEKELFDQSMLRLNEVIKMGTGAIEIKTGYGLSYVDELKMLKVIQRLKNESKIPVKTTFLGAHALPMSYKNKKQEYIDMLINKIIPVIQKYNLADFIDVFCEKDFFDIYDTEKILDAGILHGLIPKIHVNQFTSIGGIKLAVKKKSLSVDHLEVLTDEDINALKNTLTMPVALPGCSFFLGIPYTPARKLLNRNIALALATDYNPGSSPSGNMNFVVSMGCIKMKMTPAEAINAATLNGAYAMGLEDELGSITKGKKANLIMTKPIDSFNSIPYAFGSNNIDKVFINGEIV